MKKGGNRWVRNGNFAWTPSVNELFKDPRIIKKKQNKKFNSNENIQFPPTEPLPNPKTFHQTSCPFHISIYLSDRLSPTQKITHIYH